MKLLFLTSCIAVSVLSAPQALEPFFRSDYTYSARQQAFYKLNATPRKWVDAKAQCDAEGASLLVPETHAEVEMIMKMMNEQLPKNQIEVYVGIHDIFTEGTFITIEGEDVELVYNVWREGEPNDQGDDEDCVLLDRNGLYNDVGCTRKFPSVCKKAVRTLTSNPVCVTSDLAYFPDSAKSRCYKLHLEPKTWFEAFQICHAEQSYLAVLNSADEAKFLNNKLAEHPEQSLKGNFYKGGALLGFHDMFIEGNYITIHDKTLTEAGYAEWSQGQPDNAGKNENCGMMFRNGMLNDVGCSTRTLFFCERELLDPSLLDLFSRFQENENSIARATSTSP